MIYVHDHVHIAYGTMNSGMETEFLWFQRLGYHISEVKTKVLRKKKEKFIEANCTGSPHQGFTKTKTKPKFVFVYWQIFFIKNKTKTLTVDFFFCLWRNLLFCLWKNLLFYYTGRFPCLNNIKLENSVSFSSLNDAFQTHLWPWHSGLTGMKLLSSMAVIKLQSWKIWLVISSFLTKCQKVKFCHSWLHEHTSKLHKCKQFFMWLVSKHLIALWTGGHFTIRYLSKLRFNMCKKNVLHSPLKPWSWLRYISNHKKDMHARTHTHGTQSQYPSRHVPGRAKYKHKCLP